MVVLYLFGIYTVQSKLYQNRGQLRDIYYGYLMPTTLTGMKKLTNAYVMRPEKLIFRYKDDSRYPTVSYW